MRSLTFLPALGLILLAVPEPARAQTQTCSANAPTVQWTVGTKNKDGSFNTVRQEEIGYIINAAECACDTSDLYLYGRVTKALNMAVTPTVWAGTNCNTITSQPTSCESIAADVTQANFYSGAGSGAAPAQRIPVRALISPKTTQNQNPHTCIASASIGNSIFILFPLDQSNPDYCSVSMTAKTTAPAAPRTLSADSGDEAITLHWESPPVGTPDFPVYYQVLCADADGNPLADHGAYGFGETSGTNRKHQLAYSTCVNPDAKEIQRRYIAPTGFGTSNGDGGTSADGGSADPGGGEGGKLGIEADPADGGSDGSTDMALPMGPTPVESLLRTLNKKYVCSDRIAVVGDKNELRINKLKNGTAYYFVVLGIDKWGNAALASTASGDDYVQATPQPVEDLYNRFLGQNGKPQGFCFIATAAYGSYQHPFVQILRDFRDEALLPTASGRAFVDWYYRTSPPYAAWIARHDAARFVVRILLWPVIGLAWLHLHLALWQEIILLALVVAVLLRRRIRRALAEGAPAAPLSPISEKVGGAA